MDTQSGSNVRTRLARATANAGRITRAERGEYSPLSFAQQRLWFLAQLEQGRDYSIELGLRLTGTLDRNALRRSLDRILIRHESLRTTFVLLNEEPVH